MWHTRVKISPEKLGFIFSCRWEDPDLRRVRAIG